MAEAIQMRGALTRLGFSNDAASDIVDNQGIDSIEELRLLTDSEVEILCKVVRRPGGAAANGAGQNLGTSVSLRAENNLKLAAYWLQYREKTSQATLSNQITLENVRGIRGLHDWQTNHSEPTAPDNIINAKDWTKTLEALREYLRGCLGVTGIPLAYVIRENVAVSDDPANGWPSLQDKMIGRAPILDPNMALGDAVTYVATVRTDNRRVRELISALTRSQYFDLRQRTECS